MAIKLPPSPLQDVEFNNNWRVWLDKVRQMLSGVSTFSWSTIDFIGSNLTDISTRNHNDTQSKQGGTTNEYYHLTSAQHSGLTGGGSTSLHTHSGMATILSASATLNWGSISSNSVAELTITVTGAVANDCVVLGPPSGWESDLIATGFVSSADTVTIRVHNSRVSAVDPTSATWKVKVIQ